MTKPIQTALACALSAAALAVPASAVAATPASVAHVSLAIKSDTEHGKKDSKGTWHDAYLPAAFTVHAGQKVVVTVRNYDSSPHTFTATKLGLNVIIPKGSAAKPFVKTFTFTPAKVGTFYWQCMQPCDPWAMTHLGYMKGAVTVTG